MSNDMSMFKKMKERITDEVNSATNKIQNMQIIDQLTSSIGQQIKAEPNQLLPTPQDSSFSSSSNYPMSMSRNNKFSLIEDGPIVGYNEDEEINNSEISPQHQLFNEHNIKRLEQRPELNSHENTKNGILLNQNINELVRTQVVGDRQNFSDDKNSVINIEELSSDLEDELYSHDSKEDGPEDLEVDLLSDRPFPSNNNAISNTDKKSEDDTSSSYLSRYKTKYRIVVHAIRRLNQESRVEKSKLEAKRQNLESQLVALKTELDNFKQNESLNVSESDKSIAGSPQPTGKASTKIKDLERLLAKCKESLKTKNSQIQALKDSLGEVEKYKDFNLELKKELAELREAHETWTVSIAESKRAMHQEMENKNAEVEQAKAETNEVQLRLTDSNNKIRQLKTAIQDLESRLVSTSAAHQKERESLTKELTVAKNTAIRQLQKEHEHILERAKLDLEKSIELLKLDMLKKDEQIVKNVTKQEELQVENLRLTEELKACNQRFDEQLKQLNDSNDNLQKRCSDLETELVSLRSQKSELNDGLASKNDELAHEIETLNERLSLIDKKKSDLEKRLKDSESFNNHCDRCEGLDRELSSQAEKFQQDLHVVSTRLDLMTTANDDQEKEIKSLKKERDSSNELLKSLKTEIDELSKKNDSLSRVIQENETDMQTQQDQLDQLTSIKHELDLMKKENALLDEHLSRLKNELSERSLEFSQLKGQNDELVSQITDLKTDLSNTYKLSETLKKERDSLIVNNDDHQRHQKITNEQLVVKILTAMKNLETPTASPGSDKSYESSRQATSDNRDKPLPEPVDLMEDLVSLALDRSNSYMTASNRLQAVLLDNTMMGEELKRLKDELNHLNREKTLETQTSIEETERLLRENQALIHDQQSYDERIKLLEDELAALTDRLEAKASEIGQAKQEHDNDDMSVPDSMEFEYLKNIVYQFMLGKEPLVLARVISAVFKFDKSQVDQICKVQEAVQSSLRQNI